MAYTNVSDEFKEIVKSNSITASAKIIFPNLNLTILPHATDNLKSSLADLTIYDKCCDNGKYIGNAVSKKVELSIINKDNLDLADQEFELYVGVKLSNGEYEYIPYGNFIVTAYTDTKSNNKFKIEAYDYMTKLNGYFSNILYNKKTNPNGLKIDYPIKLKDFKEKILTYMGISYVDQTLPNDNFDIKVEINFDGYTIRNVIAKIAELQGTFARINRENKMEFCLQTQTDEEIPLSSMNNKQEINNRYGPVNVVSLTMKNVKGENVTLRDDKSIDKYGENTIEIQDNPFVYTEALREKAIEELYSALDGFSYYPINFNWKARLYTDGSDIIKVYDMRNKKWVNSIVMNQTIKIPATRQSTLESPALTKTQVANQYISQSKQANTRTEIIVDKQNQEIEAVVKQTVDPTNPESTVNKVSRLNIRVGELESSIKDIADITTYGESDRAEVELTDINKSEPVMVKVHPTSTNISYLYPRENLYPSDTQYLPNRIIRFTRTYEEEGTTKTENIDYELPDDLLRYSDTVYDEFYLNYESQTCQVIKRCAYNADGTVRALGTEITTDYEYPTILLGKGNYTITLPGYDFGYLYVRLMAKNIYTKAETDSRIDQKANEINLGVSKTLTNYSTTSEMNSAIDVKAKEITSSVSEKYVTNTTLTTNYSTTEATKNMINKAVDSSEEVLNEKISKVEQSSYDIKETFSSTGGNNLIYNSVGYFKSSDGKILNWTQTDGTNPLLEYGEAYNYYLNNSNAISKGVIHLRNGKLVSDSIRIATNRDLTISFKYKVSNDTKVTLSVGNFISETFSAETDWQTYTKTFNSRNTNNVQITIDTTSTYTEADDGFYITDLMLNYGNESIPWEFHQGETYNANIRMSSDGIEVGNSASDTISVYSTQGTIIYKNNNGQKGEINTQYTSKSTIERNVEILENMVQDGSSQKLVHSMINSNNNEVFVEYII